MPRPANLNRRGSLRGAPAIGLLGLVLVAVACAPAPRTSPPLVVLAVDGLDPAVLSRLLDAGRLPHLSELAKVSGVVRVIGSPGAEHASSWASWATGVNPGRHGVFDHVAPDPVSGRPAAATLRSRPSARWLGRLWREGAAYRVVRDGVPFWTHLGTRGIRSRVLFVPGTFPPEAVPAGRLVAGTPLPDWGGGFGTGYTWLASDVDPALVGVTRFGGRIEKLVFTRNVAHATLVGVRTPARIDVPLTVGWNPEARTVNLTIGDETVHLSEGQQSRWITLSLWLTPVTRIWGLVRLQLLHAGNDVRLFVSPIQWHPVAPPSAIAAPPGEAPTLYARLGPFRTLAWPEAAWPLADGRLETADFDRAQTETMADRSAAVLSHAESTDWDLLVAGIETLAATTRLRWRGPDGVGAGPDAVADAYQQLDALVGQLRARLPADAGVVVTSAFGVVRAPRVVDLNRWLTEQGWLVWREPPPPVTFAALADPAVWVDPVDAGRTRARAMGAGHLYLGSGGAGVPADRAQLAGDLRIALEGLTDPLSGRHVVARVRAASEVYRGAHVAEAPDLVVTFVPGYRGSFDTMLGGMAAATIAANDERWVAAHEGVDEDRVPGVWLANLPLTADTISVLDVAPSVAQFFGAEAAAGSDGAPQLRMSASSPSRR